MIKSSVSILISLALMPLLTGCSQDNEPTKISVNGPTNIISGQCIHFSGQLTHDDQPAFFGNDQETSYSGPETIRFFSDRTCSKKISQQHLKKKQTTFDFYLKSQHEGNKQNINLKVNVASSLTAEWAILSTTSDNMSSVEPNSNFCALPHTQKPIIHGENCLLPKFLHDYSVNYLTQSAKDKKKLYQQHYYQNYYQQYSGMDWRCAELGYRPETGSTTEYHAIVRWNRHSQPVNATTFWLTGDDGRATWSEFDPVFNIRKQLSEKDHIRSIEVQFVNKPAQKKPGDIYGGYLAQPQQGFKIPASIYHQLVTELTQHYYLTQGKWTTHVGHSNGANLIAFAMAYHQTGKFIHKAVLLNGPFLSDLGRQCEDPEYPGYLDGNIHGLRKEKTLRYLIDKMAGLDETGIKIKLPITKSNLKIIKRLKYPCLYGNIYDSSNLYSIWKEFGNRIKTMGFIVAGQNVDEKKIQFPPRRSFLNTEHYQKIYQGLSLLDPAAKKNFPNTEVVTLQGANDPYKNWIIKSNEDWYQKISAKTKHREVLPEMGHRLLFAVTHDDNKEAYQRLSETKKKHYQDAANKIYQIVRKAPEGCE